MKRIYAIGKWCGIVNCPFKSSQTINDGERKFVMWPQDTLTHKLWTKKIGNNYRKDRKTLMICSFHFDCTDDQLERLTQEEEDRIEERWNSGGSFRGRLYTTVVLPTKFIGRAENIKLVQELADDTYGRQVVDIASEETVTQGASFAIKNRWTVPWSNHQGDPDDLDDDPEDFFGPGVEVDVDLEDEENVRSQSFKSRLADLEEGPSGVQSHCAVKSCPFSDHYWHVPSHFAFPSEPHFWKQWVALCEYELGSRQEHLETVCSHHFAPSAFFEENFLGTRGYGRLGKRIIKPNARPTLYIQPEVNRVLRQRWQFKKMDHKLTGTTSLQEYTRLCKGGMGKISRSKLEEGGSDELEALRGEFSQDMLTPEFPVEPDVADVEIEECMWRSGIRGTVLQHLGDSVSRPRMYTKKEKISRNSAKIEWMENRVAELEELCLKQKLVIAQNYAAVGQGQTMKIL